MDNKTLKEILVAAGLILISLLAFGIAGISEIGIIIASGALGFIMLRGNMLSVILSVGLVFAADFSAGLSFNFSNSLVVCMCAFAINFAIRAKMGLLHATVAGVVGIFAAFGIMFAVAQLADISGMKLADARAFFESANEMIDMAVAQSGFEKLYSASEIAKLKSLTSMIMVPVTFITMAVFISYYAIVVLKKMLKVSKSSLGSEIVDFSCIKADKMCLLVWGASLLLFAAVAMNNQVIGAAAFCMLYILSAFYLICGISIMWYFAGRKRGVKKVLFVILIIFAVLFMTPTVFIFGMVDSFINIRRLRKGE